jgi:hypothetical protein
MPLSSPRCASHDALLCFTCTPRTCRLYDDELLHSVYLPSLRQASFSTWVNVKIILLSHPVAICGASLCSPSTPGSLTLPKFCSEYIYSASALTRVFLVRSSSRPNMPINDRLVCALHPVCSDFQLRLFSVVKTTAPDRDFRTLLRTVWFHDSPIVSFVW